MNFTACPNATVATCSNTTVAVSPMNLVPILVVSGLGLLLLVLMVVAIRCKLFDHPPSPIVFVHATPTRQQSPMPRLPQLLPLPPPPLSLQGSPPRSREAPRLPRAGRPVRGALRVLAADSDDGSVGGDVENPEASRVRGDAISPRSRPRPRAAAHVPQPDSPGFRIFITPAPLHTDDLVTSMEHVPHVVSTGATADDSERVPDDTESSEL